MAPIPPFLSGRLASAVTDMARWQFMPRTQKALADDKLVQMAASWRRSVAALPGGGVVGFLALPGALLALAVASKYDSAIAQKATGMRPWLRTGTGLCFVASFDDARQG